jgi:LysR family nitrogen assimilation transcriptional regulator
MIEIDRRQRKIELFDVTIRIGDRRGEPAMDFKQLRAFLTVADTGNVTRAAEMLNLVQPAVSRQLHLLEEDVGTALFERQRHGMALTEAGKSLQVYARRAMLELDRARAEIDGATSGEIAGLATVGLLPSTSDLLAPALLNAVNAKYPRIRTRISMGYAGTLQQWLRSGEIDVALLYGTERTEKIETQPLLEEALWVIAPAVAGLRASKPVTLNSLSGRALILPSGPHGIRTLVDHACAVSHVELTIAAETNAMSIQKSLVLAGHGWTILPPIACADELERRSLSAAPLRDPSITRTIVLALPSDRTVPRHVQVVADLLVTCAKDAVHSSQWPRATWIAS